MRTIRSPSPCLQARGASALSAISGSGISIVAVPVSEGRTLKQPGTCAYYPHLLPMKYFPSKKAMAARLRSHLKSLGDDLRGMALERVRIDPSYDEEEAYAYMLRRRERWLGR